MPDFRAVRRSPSRSRARPFTPAHRDPRALPARRHARRIPTTSASSAPTKPRRTACRPSTKRVPKTWMEDILPEDSDGTEIAPTGRVMEMLSEHTLEGWLEGYVLTGRHGFFSTYEAFVHVIDSMFNQHAKWLEKSKKEIRWRASISVYQSPDHVVRVAPGSQRLLPSGSGLPRRRREQERGGRRASICRPTRIACSASPITACAAATTSTSSSRTSSLTSSTSIWTRRSAIAQKASESGTGPAPSRR